ncbi:T-cell immunoglobulin and mucin domain-containing protein 4 isoform X2 [Elephas maximus indicus]|uniref:T-cell immunoglobulin and mucin domain-containing protein 4 isoform X2 n=1 Tax=Elephas maximus indicus TaxID=99487 RepID=UPI0021161F41|nr:T-cell immunoglobulin and mucin domain-containing protein 4 isoform X2 [Elephas maximus indicus]
MSKGPVILWLVFEFGQLYLTPATSETVVTAFLGQSVTLPCKYSSWSPGRNSMCWGKGQCPSSKCNEELLHTDGTKVLWRQSVKYRLPGNIQSGDVSLTISNTNEGDSSLYCCRIEVPGWFNDVKSNIRLLLKRVSKMAILVHNEVESEQMKMSYNSDLLMIIAPCVGFVVFLLLLGFLLRGKVTKTNCLQKNTRQENVGGNKNVLNDVLLGTEDEDGVFTL